MDVLFAFLLKNMDKMTMPPEKLPAAYHYESGALEFVV